MLWLIKEKQIEVFMAVDTKKAEKMQPQVLNANMLAWQW